MKIGSGVSVFLRILPQQFEGLPMREMPLDSRIYIPSVMTIGLDIRAILWVITFNFSVLIIKFSVNNSVL
jgi:hypothetical protein